MSLFYPGAQPGDVGDAWTVQEPTGHRAIDGGFDRERENHIRFQFMDELQIVHEQLEIFERVQPMAGNCRRKITAADGDELVDTLSIRGGYPDLISILKQSFDQLPAEIVNDNIAVDEKQYFFHFLDQKYSLMIIAWGAVPEYFFVNK